MNHVVERITDRLDALDSSDDPKEMAEQHLLELLPLDDARREENEVWLAFTARALVDPELRECAERSYDLLRTGCRRWVEAIAGGQVDISLETDRLHALIDGLAVHVAIRPTVANAERVRAVLAGHLASLAARGA
jgi:hypothetical protein